MQHAVKQATVMAAINVSPMMDVMLVLLIIFIVVTPVQPYRFPGQLPHSTHLEGLSYDSHRTTLGIDKQGNYYLNNQRIAVADAPRLLELEFARHPEDRVLSVLADRRLRYGHLTEALRVAATAGARVGALVIEQYPNERRGVDDSGRGR